MVFAAMTGEDLVVAVVIDVGDANRVAVVEGVVEDFAGTEVHRFEPELGGRSFGVSNRDLMTVPRVDGRQESPPIGEPAEMDFARPAPGSVAFGTVGDLLQAPLNANAALRARPRDDRGAEVVGGQDDGGQEATIDGRFQDLERVRHRSFGDDDTIPARCGALGIDREDLDLGTVLIEFRRQGVCAKIARRQGRSVDV